MTVDRSLHVVTGDSAAGTLREALGPGESVLVQRDVLSWGPLPPLDSLEPWRSVRADYWRSIWKGPPLDDSPHDLLEHGEALAQATLVNLWMSPGTADQMLLPFIGRLFELLQADPAKLNAIVFVRHARSGRDIVSLGELPARDLWPYPAPSCIDPPAQREAARAWAAVTAPEPTALLDVVSGESGSLPLLPRALAPLVGRYPDERSGLGIWDEALLAGIRDHGPEMLSVLVNVMAGGTDPLDPAGDVTLLGRMMRLADTQLPRPLLELTGEGWVLRDRHVRMTPAGEEVLAGRASFIDLNGIDEWIAGVHLDSRAGKVWVRRDGSLVEA